MLTKDKARFCIKAHGKWDSASATCDHGMRPKDWCSFTGGDWDGERCEHVFEEINSGSGSGHQSHSGSTSDCSRHEDVFSCGSPYCTWLPLFEGALSFEGKCVDSTDSNSHSSSHWGNNSSSHTSSQSESGSHWGGHLGSGSFLDSGSGPKAPTSLPITCEKCEFGFERQDQGSTSECGECKLCRIECPLGYQLLGANERGCGGACEKEEEEEIFTGPSWKEELENCFSSDNTVQCASIIEEKKRTDHAVNEKEASDAKKDKLEAIAKMEDAKEKAEAYEKMRREEEAEKAAQNLEAHIMNQELKSFQLDQILNENDQCTASRTETECDAEAMEKLKQLNVTSKDGEDFSLDDIKRTKKKREGEKQMKSLDVCMEKAASSASENMALLRQKEQECMKEAFAPGLSASGSKNIDDTEEEFMEKVIRAKEEAHNLKKEEEEQEFHNLFGNFFAEDKSEDSLTTDDDMGDTMPDASTKKEAEEDTESSTAMSPTEEKVEKFKQTLYESGALCKKNGCTKTEAYLKAEDMMRRAAAKAATSSLTECSGNYIECNKKAKKEAELRYGALDDVTFQEMKEEATAKNVYKRVASVMEAALKSGSGDTSKAIESMRDSVKDAVKAEIAALMGNRKGSAEANVTDRDVNKYLEKIQVEATLNAVEAAGQYATPAAKRSQIKKALAKAGKLVNSDAEIVNVQNRAVENKIGSIFKGDECTSGKKACMDVAQNQAAFTLGREVSLVEVQRFRERGAEAAAADLLNMCETQGITESECNKQKLNKMRTITGDEQLTVSKMHVFVNRGVQSNAANDMETCIDGGQTALICREKILASIGRAMGHKRTPPEEASSMLRKGGYLAVKRKVAACREVANDEASEKKCRDISAMLKDFAAATGLSGTDSTVGEEIKREMDCAAFMEAAELCGCLRCNRETGVRK
eukprot:g1420.t1